MQYMNIIFVCNEELKRGHARLFTLFTWQPTKVPTAAVGMKTCARNYYVRTIVGTLVRFEVGHERSPRVTWA